MKQKMFLTSAIAMGVVAPAFAAPTYTSDTFPSSGLMQEDYTYKNAATATNMDSVYEGSVNAVAEYDIVDYILSAGQYLPADSETVTTCPAGSFCSGIGEVQYNETSAQGIETCPTGFGSSAAGASSANECYRTCSGNVEIEHATGVTGNDYYGTGTDTCEPTGCVNGWHLKSGVNGSAIATAIGETAGENSAYINASGSFGEMNYDGQGAKGEEYYSLTDNNTWAVDYGDKGFLYGQARCSTVQGVFDFNWSTHTLNQPITTHTTSELGDEGGKNKYCYCNVTGYTPDGGTLQSLSSSWVSAGDFVNASNCASRCALNCAFYVQDTDSSRLPFRAALLGAIQSGPAMCEATNYLLNAGQYLPADSETVTTCPAGSFCSGIGSVQYNETSAQGITSCPSGFGSSETGSSSNTQCYRACDIDNMGDSITAIAHATAISGNDYYGSGTDTCVPTACENGWHVKAGTTGPNLTSLIGITEAGVGHGYISNDGNDTSNEDTYGITQNGEFVVDYGSKGKIHGHAQCSTQSGTGVWNGASDPSDVTASATLPDSSGRYCYCQLDSYTPVSGSAIALSTPWVFNDGNSDAGSCADVCADNCASTLWFGFSSGFAFRAAVFGSVHGLPTCEANTITINWSNADAEDISANNAGTATYGEDVRTPVKAETIKGKTFKGWKFSKPEQTPLP